MIKHLYYKEWVKTRFFLAAMAAVVWGVSAYTMLFLCRAVSVKGAGHIWEVMVAKDAIFVDLLEYIPLLAGILLGVMQYAPEMYNKCLKLTLHLPMGHLKVTNVMLSFGFIVLALTFGISLAGIFIVTSQSFPHELYGRIIMTTLPWFLAGFAGYFMTAWVILEPAWRRRIFNIIVSLALLRVYFLAPAPEAYNGFLPMLAIVTLLTATLSWISVDRFKAGCQD